MHSSHQKLLKLVKIERQTLAEILSHLQIINDQKVFTQMNYASLLDYCVKELGYSESAAYRRIQALRLKKKLPEVNEKIADGKINLSTASKLNQLIDQKEKEMRKPLTTTTKRALLGLIENKPTANAEEIIREKLQLPPKKKFLTIEMTQESYEKWIQFKGKHIAKRLTDEALLLFALREADRPRDVRQVSARKAAPQAAEVKKESAKQTRFISAQVRREVFARASYCCQHPNCASTYGLEIDHKRPVSKGGMSRLENLQLLCRHHNQLKSNR